MAHPVQQVIETLHEAKDCPRVLIDALADGVICPKEARLQQQQRLSIDLDPDWPLDLAFKKDSFCVDLSFDGPVERCEFPYAAISRIENKAGVVAYERQAKVVGGSEEDPALSAAFQTAERDFRCIGILLGASAFPLASYEGGPQYKASSVAVLEYLRTAMGVTKALDLFDSDLHVSQMHEAMIDFLAEEYHDATDLVVYYVGHGGLPLGARALCLAIRRTREHAEHVSSLVVSDLATSILQHFPRRRIYVILDCCYAAEAVSHFQSAAAEVTLKSIEQSFPTEGISLLVASSKDDVALAPLGMERTLFTDSLIHVLQSSDATALSMCEIRDLILVRLMSYPEYVRPEVHSPRQQRGELSRVKFFRTRRRGPVQEGATGNEGVGGQGDRTHGEAASAGAPASSVLRESSQAEAAQSGVSIWSVSALLVTVSVIVLLVVAMVRGFSSDDRGGGIVDAATLQSGVGEQREADVRTETEEETTWPAWIALYFVSVFSLALPYGPYRAWNHYRADRAMKEGVMMAPRVARTREDFAQIVKAMGGILTEEKRRELLERIFTLDDRPLLSNEKTIHALRYDLEEATAFSLGEHVGMFAFFSVIIVLGWPYVLETLWGLKIDVWEIPFP